MSRLAAAALRRGVAASRGHTSSRLTSSMPASVRLFSADASGETTATAADSQDDSFLKSSNEAFTTAIRQANQNRLYRIEGVRFT
nr:unnamed protein product [Digitaria exilis]